MVSMFGTAGASIQWWWPLLLGAALTLVAGLLGKAFEAERSKAAWLRDHKLRCFAALLAEAHDAGRLIGDLATEEARTCHEIPLTSPTTDAEKEASRLVNAATALVNGRIAEVKLLGDKQTGELADKLGRSIVDASGTFHSREWLKGRSVHELVEAFDNHEHVVAMNAAVDAFTVAARKEIL